MMSAACLPKSPSWSMMLAKILIRMLMMMSSTRIHWSSSSRQPQARGQEWLSTVKAVIREKRQCYWDQGCLNLDWRSSWSSTVFPASCARNTGSTFFQHDAIWKQRSNGSRLTCLWMKGILSFTKCSQVVRFISAAGTLTTDCEQCDVAYQESVWW